VYGGERPVAVDADGHHQCIVGAIAGQSRVIHAADALDLVPPAFAIECQLNIPRIPAEQAAPSPDVLGGSRDGNGCPAFGLRQGAPGELGAAPRGQPGWPGAGLPAVFRLACRRASGASRCHGGSTYPAGHLPALALRRARRECLGHGFLPGLGCGRLLGESLLLLEPRQFLDALAFLSFLVRPDRSLLRGLFFLLLELCQFLYSLAFLSLLLGPLLGGLHVALFCVVIARRLRNTRTPLAFLVRAQHGDARCGCRRGRWCFLHPGKLILRILRRRLERGLPDGGRGDDRFRRQLRGTGRRDDFGIVRRHGGRSHSARDWNGRGRFLGTGGHHRRLAQDRPERGDVRPALASRQAEPGQTQFGRTELEHQDQRMQHQADQQRQNETVGVPRRNSGSAYSGARPRHACGFHVALPSVMSRLAILPCSAQVNNRRAASRRPCRCKMITRVE